MCGWPTIRSASGRDPWNQSRSKLMAIVPFPGTDWTNDERAEIRRLEKVCDASEDWSLECSHTDAGDPWCVVYDRHQDHPSHRAYRQTIRARLAARATLREDSNHGYSHRPRS